MTEKPLIARKVKHYGEIGAGRVIPFIPRGVTTEIYVADESLSDDDFGTITVRGRSLEDEGIFDGDVLIFCRKFARRDVTPHTVCILYVKSAAELMAKKVLFDRRDELTLRSSGGGCKDLYFEPEDVDIWGVAVGMQRYWGKGTRIPRRFDPDIPF